MTILADAFNAIVKVATQAAWGAMDPQVVEVAGRHFIKDATGMKELDLTQVDENEYLVEGTLLDIDSVLAWAHATGVKDGLVLLSRTGLTAALSPKRVNKWHDRSKMGRPFFADRLPPDRSMNYAEFRLWFDSLGEGLEQRAELEAQLMVFGASAAKGTHIKMTGAVIQMQGETAQEVMGVIPRVIAAEIPFGDPAFSTRVSFLLTVTARDGNLSFRAQHQAVDGAHDRFVAWARTKLTDALPEGWSVLVSP